MTPLPGARAPPLDLRTLDGRFDLHAQDGWQLVVFLRGLHCGHCKEQAQDVAVHVDTLRDLGAEATLVSMETEERAGRMQDDWRLRRVRVAYGMDAETAHAWGLVISNGRGDEPERFNEPGMALVRPDGTIQGTWVQSLPYGRPDMTDIVEALRHIQTKDVPPRAEAERLRINEVEARSH